MAGKHYLFVIIGADEDLNAPLTQIDNTTIGDFDTAWSALSGYALEMFEQEVRPPKYAQPCNYSIRDQHLQIWEIGTPEIQ